MAKTIMYPGGGAFPSRPDEKISSENFVFVGAAGYTSDDNPNHKRSLKRIQKRTQTKKRRQRDKLFNRFEGEN